MVTLELQRKQLLYDIRNYAYIEGHLMGEGADAQHAKHVTQDVGEKGNIDRVNRILTVVHAALVELLYPYTKRGSEADRITSDMLRQPESYVIELRVPQDFSDTTVNLLLHLCHEYMVYRAIADWLSLTKPQAAANWAAKAQAAQQEISSVKARSMGKTRIKPFPAW